MKANYCNELEAAAVLRDVNEWGGYVLAEPVGQTYDGLMLVRLHIRHPRLRPTPELDERVRGHSHDIAALLAKMCLDTRGAQ